MADVLETDSEGIHEERSIHSTGKLQRRHFDFLKTKREIT